MELRSIVDGLASLPLHVEEVSVRELVRGARRTNLVVMRGDGHEGFGEDVTHDERDRTLFRALDVSRLRGKGALGELLRDIDALDLGAAVSWPVIRSYRRWALESAATDLALRQADLPFAGGSAVAPMSFVVSLRVDAAAPVLDLLERAPQTRLKLDARASWDAETVGALAATRAVDVIDLKGTAPRSPVYEPPDAARYARLAKAFPEAIFEDPAVELAHLLPRASWDEPVQRADALERLPRVDAVNVKPARLGSLAETFALVDACRVRGIGLYGGGHSEIGPGRGQAQLLAALLYPDAPNDLAPLEPAASPLVPPAPRSTGFRWT